MGEPLERRYCQTRSYDSEMLSRGHEAGHGSCRLYQLRDPFVQDADRAMAEGQTTQASWLVHDGRDVRWIERTESANIHAWFGVVSGGDGSAADGGEK